MADKQLTFDEDARASLMRGVDELKRVVGLTLGPSGRNVLLSRMFGLPIVCSDGVTVAKEVELPEPYENLGAQLVKEAASKTNDAVGDGTTTSVVLAQSIVRNGFMNVASGANGIGIRDGVDMAVDAVIAELKTMAIPVEDRARVARVAALSAHEEPIAELLADALDKVGRDGVVTIEESKSLLDELEFVEGVRVDRGYLSPHFISDTQRMEVAIDNPMFLITDQKVSAPNDVIGIMEKLLQANSRSLVIIAEDVDGEALSTLVVNKLRGTIDCVAIKAPGFGERRKALLEDIAIVTGGTVISADRGLKVEEAEIEMLGSARRLVATKDESTIVEGRGDDNAIKERLDQLRVQIEETSSDYDREKLQERMAALVGGVAVLKIGGATEPEINERKSRAEDALSATRAAIEEGIVPGGGVALVRAGHVLNDLVKTLEGDQALGVRMVRDSLSAPLMLISDNAGHEGQVVLDAVRNGEADWGFDADKGEYCNLIEAGIIDPVKVTRSALENAGSIAGMMMTTQAIITEIPEFVPLPQDIQDFMHD
ncbi:MAG: chaperonin GroEL [SAR202 cluster bacterium]|jgi:chaperonin GroEL|nr:chaperonin GroEL [Dehalococcoidia bacterium]MQF87997.1 chaperonin GroEL [SAR202 cluster bacterium]|tara:strand:+ start:3467 stop:5092 length:1626 start_codon:yes stop_codon:yes gene_type:complete